MPLTPENPSPGLLTHLPLSTSTTPHLTLRTSPCTISPICSQSLTASSRRAFSRSAGVNQGYLTVTSVSTSSAVGKLPLPLVSSTCSGVEAHEGVLGKGGR